MSARHFGKTGLIQHIFHKMTQSDSGIVCIYMDIYHTQNQNDFVKTLAENVLGKADANLEKAMNKFASFFKSFRPVL